MTGKSFKDEFSLEKRKAESENLMSKYPNRIGIIVEQEKSNNSVIPPIDKRKYAVYNDMKFSSFMNVIRNRLKLSPEIALIFFVNGSNILTGNQIMSEIYNQYKDEDGFIYIKYTGENTFGQSTLL